MLIKVLLAVAIATTTVSFTASASAEPTPGIGGAGYSCPPGTNLGGNELLPEIDQNGDHTLCYDPVTDTWFDNDRPHNYGCPPAINAWYAEGGHYGNVKDVNEDGTVCVNKGRKVIDNSL